MNRDRNREHPAVSIIIPVYNVESWLKQCIESIGRQTFHDYELLLIDDGSSDRSPAICEEAAAADPRIRCFRKTNGGLSDARNYGMERAAGTYITFIDADDYVAETYLETLLYLCITCSAPLACVDFHVTGREAAIREVRQDPGVCLSPVEALKRCLIRDGFGVSACGKMYHRSLISFLHFPVGRRYEDLLTIPRLFERCNRVVCCRDKLYYYRIREGSITHRRLEEEDFRQTEILLDLVKYVDEYAPEIHDAAVCRLFAEVFHNILYRLVFDERYPLLTGRIRSACDRYFRESRSNPYLTKGKKMQIFLFSREPSVFRWLCMCFLIFKEKSQLFFR